MVHRTLARRRKTRRVFLPILVSALVLATAVFGCRSRKTSAVEKAPTTATVSTDTPAVSEPATAPPVTEAPTDKPTSQAMPEPVAAEPETWSITILHTNDVAGEIDPCG